MFNSRVVSAVLALVVSGVTTAFVSLIDDTPTNALILAAIMSFVSAFMLSYFSMEYLIFRELQTLHVAIEKLRRKDFKLTKSRFGSIEPIRKLNDEMMRYASKKEQEIDELKRIENYRREFLADISHELKTPIFAAQGFVHTLLDGAADDPEVRDQFLKKAAKSLDGLEALVQDLITLSQMETGYITMKIKPLEISELINDIFEQLEKKAQKRNTTFKLDCKADKKYWVLGDVNRIGQVLINLIENAIKYGNEGGKVIVGLESAKDFVIVTVRDNGPGIADEHQKRIFDRFYRIDKSRSKDKGGTGLGLAIVKQIIDAHGSKISVNSKVGRGTTFEFRLEKTNSPVITA